jgi:16S rRNA (guanine527-N7)-methyltransferase
MTAREHPEERLRALGERWALSTDQIAALGRALDLLATDPHAPTAVRGAQAVDIHAADSLTALALEPVRSAQAIADLGSGAGFPGLALAIALPQARVALVESAARKCDFLERICAVAGAPNAHVVHARAEAWPQGLGVHDLVTARALAPLAVVLEYAAPLLARGGALVAWKGALSQTESGDASRSAAMLGMAGADVIRSSPYAGSVAHHLHVYTKVTPTPAGFPRRPGLARRRPLGGAA